VIRLLPIEAATYVGSVLHAPDRVWRETNCYVDIWIELLHALDLEPHAALPFTVSVDFEGDQWQFFKFPLEDLRFVYGLDVAEMNPWREIEHHVEEQLDMGRFLTVEVDSWFLPDTAGVSYQIDHVKTSIIPNMIDRDARRLGYFHGAGYYEIEGPDYAGVFRLDGSAAGALPPYVELIKLDRLVRPPADDVTARAVALLAVHLARRPTSNPVSRFRERFKHDLDWLGREGLELFHGYAFATLRQFGASCELLGSFCSWLSTHGEATDDAGEDFTAVARAAKTAQFKLARLATGRDADVDPSFDAMTENWDAGMAKLVELYE
jgi:Domain of unknown function (DUF1839)